MLFNHTEFNAFFLLNLFLQLFSKFFIGLVGHNSEGVNLKPVNALAILIDTYTQATANLLPFLDNGIGFVKRTDLEDVGIIPAFFQGGMWEYELKFGIKAE